MQTFSRDVSLTATAPSVDGQHWTALGIQTQILAKLEDHVDNPVMPEWASEALVRLREILDRLKQGANATSKTLDWSVKLALYQDYTSQQGIEWATLSTWDDPLRTCSCPAEH